MAFTEQRSRRNTTHIVQQVNGALSKTSCFLSKPDKCDTFECIIIKFDYEMLIFFYFYSITVAQVRNKD